MVEAIRERTSIAQALTRAQIEWQTKILAGFIASTAMDAKASRELHKAVSAISMFPEDEETQSSSTEPRAGSYEKLSAMFGGGMAR